MVTDLTGVEHEFRSQSDPGIMALEKSLSQSVVSELCLGKRKHKYGFSARFKEEAVVGADEERE